MASSGRTQGRIFWGLVLIIVGGLFLLDQMDRLDLGRLMRHYWPVIFIILGLSILISHGSRNAGGGIFLILFGTFFLLAELHIFRDVPWHYVWPALIILLGLWIIVRPAHAGDKKKILDAAVTVDELAISQVFSGTSRRIESQSFKGGTAEVVLGSAEIDMTGAALAGGEATVSLSVVLGSIEIRMPAAWQVTIEGTPVLGSIEQERKGTAGGTGGATLHLKTSVVLGSIHIKD